MTGDRRDTETFAAAVRWREAMAADRIAAQAEARLCGRCKGTGLTWWCGRPGEGGKRGPCPRCQHEGANRFATELAEQNFGEVKRPDFTLVKTLGCEAQKDSRISWSMGNQS